MKTRRDMKPATRAADLSTPANEIISRGPLLDENGKLVQTGWARFPYLDCNLENAGRHPRGLFQRLRLKRWDYYAVTTPDLFLSITLAHLGYVGTVFAYVVDYGSDALHEETLLAPFGAGIELARNADSGSSHFDNGRARVAFEASDGERHVRFSWPGFDRKRGLEADIVLRCGRDHESVVTATDMGGPRFFYTRKVNCMPGEGRITWGDRQVDLKPNTSLGTLDWGRGIWPYSTSWIWASASAFLESGRTLGMNMGSGFGDASAPDNALILGGRVHKLDQVTFAYDHARLMAPWRMTSPDGRVSLDFQPFKERVARTNLVVVKSEVHQIFGRYNGFVESDDGERVSVHDVIGFVEEHHARW